MSLFRRRSLRDCEPSHYPGEPSRETQRRDLRAGNKIRNLLGNTQVAAGRYFGRQHHWETRTANAEMADLNKQSFRESQHGEQALGPSNHGRAQYQD